MTDTVGNSSSANLNVTLTKIDNMAPIISSFSVDDLVVNITSEGSTSAATVTFTAIVSDNVAVDSVSLPNTTHVSL